MQINFRQEAEKIEDEIIENYEYLHRHPELSGQEINTQRRILEQLEAWKVEAYPCAQTGVCAVIRGQKGGHTIALRADMDALPVKEDTGLPYQSEAERIMHACGHDAHMSILLGTIHIMKQYEDRIQGNLVFLFQPSEERNGGAERMIREGVLEDPPVEFAVAFHVWCQKAHTISCIPGPVMAQPDGFRIDVVGKGGHGAAPHLGRNPVSALASLVTAAERIPSMTVNPLKSAVVDVCNIHCGERYNLTADSGFIEGTVRTYDKDTRDGILRELKRIAQYIPSAYGMKGSFSMNSGYPATVNDSGLARRTAEILKEKMQHTRILTQGEPSMLGEDFSCFGQKVPILFLRLGCQPEEQEKQYPLHHPRFQIDESVLIDGTEAFCTLAYEFLRGGDCFEDHCDAVPCDM